MVKQKILYEAIKAASRSTFDHKVGSVIYKSNKILSVGFNQAQTTRHSITKKYLKWPTSIHSEVDAIIKARCDLKRASIVVVRINKRGELRLAKPCLHCLAYIQYVQIRNIYYSTNEGGIDEILD
jgi:deoxycytidylate deaminase